MRKSILRFGALALMSMMSIGAFAINTVGEVFKSPTDGNEYRITKVYQASPVSIGEVELVRWSPTSALTEIGDNNIQDSYFNVFLCTSIQGKSQSTSSAFLNTNPGTITIGKSITKIGANAFSKLNGDVTISFDEDAKNLESIGNGAFSPEAKKVTVSNTLLDLSKAAVNTLGEGAFANVTFATNTEVRLGDIATVPAKLFQNSTNLTYVLFNALNKLTEIKESAFEGCSSIKWFGYFDTVLDAHFLPYTLTTIGKKAFKGALHYDATNKLPEFKFSVSFKNLSLADVPFAEITSVGESAFEGCAWLDNVYFCNLFPATLVSAESVKVLAGGQRTNAAFTYGNAAFASSILKGKYDFTARTDVTFNNAFKGNAAITEAILPTSTETIGYEAFKGCTALKLCDLTKLPALAKIEYSAFQNTDNYVNVWIPNTVTFIGENAFTRANENLAPSRTIAILSKESTEAQAVSKVIRSYTRCNNTPERWHATQPITDYTNTTLVVPMGLMKAYATAKFPATGHIANCSSSPEGYDWSPAAGHLYTYDTNAKNVGDKIYVGYYEYTVTTDWSNQYTAGCSEYPLVKLTAINNVALGNVVNKFTETLYDNTKSDLTRDFKLQLPQTVCAQNEWDNGALAVTKLGPENTHTGFLGLNSENNANGVNFVFYWVEKTAKMSELSYSYKYNYTWINAIKNHVTEAEVQADKIDLTGVFNGCTNLASFDFQGYPNLVNANNASGNTPKNAVTGWYGAIGAPNEANIGEYAFNGCTSLATFNGVTEAGFKYTDGTNTGTDNTVGQYAFYNCPLTSVVIPNNVLVIKNNAYQKTRIQAVKFPMGLTTINDQAFANTPLTWVRLPKSITYIGHYVFDGKAKEIEGEGDLEGIVVDGELEGVLDIYAYWGKTELGGLTVELDAFGDAEKVFVGEEPKYIVRRLYIPDGETDNVASTNDYTEEAPFNDNHKFTFAEGIIVKTPNFSDDDLYRTGRVDIVIDQKTAVRKLTIVDNNDIQFFRISKTTPNVQVTYKRKVQAGVYNPLFVPFSVAGVGDDYQIYKVFDTKVDENGKESIEYVKLRADEVTRPNVPYVILPTANEIELKAKAYQDEHITPLPAKNTYFNTTDVCNYAVYPAVTTDPRVTCSDAANEYKFYGTVQEKKGTTVAADAFYALTSENHFAKMTDPNKSVKALRFYMTTREKNYGTEYFYIKGLDLDEVTAIEDVKANSLNAPMFDLMGRQIAAPAKGQVYIQNGVKKLAK